MNDINFYTDAIYGLSNLLLENSIKSLGKALGSLAVFMCMLALAYYVVRELYVRLVVKRKMFPVVVERGLGVTILSYLRRYHPYFGLLATLAAGVHGYLLWGIVFHFRVTGRVSSGILLFVFLGCVFVSGIALKMFRRQRIILGKIHMFFAVLFFLILLLHVGTKINLYDLL